MLLIDLLFVKEAYVNRNDGTTFIDIITDNRKKEYKSPTHLFWALKCFSIWEANKPCIVY